MKRSVLSSPETETALEPFITEGGASQSANLDAHQSLIGAELVAAEGRTNDRTTEYTIRSPAHSV